METTQLLIIGAGPGGYETAIAAARAGLSTVLVEDGSLGGTCLNEGCIPTKCLCRNAEVFDMLREASVYGVRAESVNLDWSAVIGRKDEVVSQLKTGVQGLLKSPFITIVKGHARFVAPHIVAVGDIEYTSPFIIIATGSEAKRLPVPGAELPKVVTAREMLRVAQLPHRLCVVGGGVVGLEFASIFHSFGSEVSVVEYAKEVLPAFDRDIAKRLRTTLKRRGIHFHLGAAVSAITSKDDGCEVQFDTEGQTGSVEADLVLMSVGRCARVADLGLENTGIHYSQRGIAVDAHMQTNVSGIYAVGDVNGLCPLAHAATAQGLCALNHLLGNADTLDLQLIPAAVFTVPEVSTVGLTEEQATEQGLPYKILKSFYRANGKSLAMGATDGLVKILIDDHRRILGAHILGAHAADLIHELALAMHSHLSVDEIRNLVHAHPSLSEIVHAAAAG